jgi:DNA-directed RNA polymerase subunit RPC12/RpoP
MVVDMSRDMLYECIVCGYQEIVFANDHRKDGRKCSECFQRSTPIGYAGIDLAKGESIAIKPKKLEELIL